VINGLLAQKLPPPELAKGVDLAIAAIKNSPQAPDNDTRQTLGQLRAQLIQGTVGRVTTYVGYVIQVLLEPGQDVPAEVLAGGLQSAVREIGNSSPDNDTIHTLEQLEDQVSPDGS
jgi:hypothetical protein